MTFGIPTLTRSPRRLRPDKAEPRLFPEPAQRPFGEAAIADAPPLSAIATEERAPIAAASATSPMISMRDRRPAPAASGLPAGTLFYLGLVGLVAALTIGAFFGVGFLLLAAPEKPTTAAAGPNFAHPSAPTSLETGLPPHPAAATAAIPGPALPPHPAASETAPLPQIRTAQGISRHSAATEPPTQIRTAHGISRHSANTEPPPQIGPKPALGHPAPAIASSAPKTAASSSPEHAAPRPMAGSAPPRLRRVAHTRSDTRRSPVRSVRSERSPAPPRPRVAQSATRSEAGQSHAFDQLLTQLTGPSKPVEEHSAPTPLTSPSLTPPEADRPDPFAPPAGTDRGGSAPVQ